MVAKSTLNNRKCVRATGPCRDPGRYARICFAHSRTRYPEALPNYVLQSWRITIDDQARMPLQRERPRQIRDRGRLPGPAFLIDHGNRSSHSCRPSLTYTVYRMRSTVHVVLFRAFAVAVRSSCRQTRQKKNIVKKGAKVYSTPSTVYRRR